jgi:hypothetical protein
MVGTARVRILMMKMVMVPREQSNLGEDWFWQKRKQRKGVRVLAEDDCGG